MAIVLPCVLSHISSDNDVSASLAFVPNRETARSAYEFTNSIGVNTHINYFDTTYGDFPLLERELKAIGILHLRDGIHLQNSGYNEALYARWIQLGKLGIRFDAVLDPRNNLPPLTAAVLENVNALAGDTIEAFEGPNEFDVSNITDWPSVDRDYQKRIFASVKSSSSGAHINVIGPSMAFARHGAELGDIDDRADAINLHPYPAGKMPSAIFPEQIALAKIMSSSKQIIFTETGYHNALNDHRDQPAVSEAAAAKYIPRLFLEDFARGVPRTYLYEFMDEKPNAGLNDNQLHWGLIRADGSEKPAFSALKNLLEELHDSNKPSHLEQLSWSLNTSDPQIHHLLLQKSNGVLDLVLWQEVPSYDPTRQTDLDKPKLSAVLELDQPARIATLFEPSERPAAVKSYTATASIPVEIPDSPLVVEISLY
jgi:hypothetical protein